MGPRGQALNTLGFNGAWPSQHLLTSCWRRKEEIEAGREERGREKCKGRKGERETERESKGAEERELWRSGSRLKEKGRKVLKRKRKNHPVIYEVLWPFHSLFFIFSLLPLSQGLLVEFKQPWQ